MVFARYLKEELTALGLEEITLDENGYLFATLPANTDKPVPTIGFIAHMDTSPDMSGKEVSPRIVSAYDGGDIPLSGDGSVVLSPERFPELLDHKGEDLIVTDGRTLLGADDKAGIAEIVSAIVYLQQHPEIKHGKVRIGFNPDEEIGLGAISLTWSSLVAPGPTPWMAVRWGNWSLKTSMPHRPPLPLSAVTFTRGMPRTRCSTRCA